MSSMAGQTSPPTQLSGHSPVICQEAETIDLQLNIFPPIEDHLLPDTVMDTRGDIKITNISWIIKLSFTDEDFPLLSCTSLPVSTPGPKDSVMEVGGCSTELGEISGSSTSVSKDARELTYSHQGKFRVE